jgi:hypothetical protein
VRGPDVRAGHRRSRRNRNDSAMRPFSVARPRWRWRVAGRAGVTWENLLRGPAHGADKRLGQGRPWPPRSGNP